MSRTPNKDYSEERTQVVKAPSFHDSGKAWRDFTFTGLEQVTRAQVRLADRLEWLLPAVASTGEVAESVTARLSQLFETDVQMALEFVHVVPTRRLKRYLGDPAFIAVLSPAPNKTRAFLEVDLSLAHSAIDMLLGGEGEALALRPLTDIEEGVMSYLIIELLKQLAPDLDPGLPRLRLERACQGPNEVLQLLGDEPDTAVVQLKLSLGTANGFVRLFIPSSVLAVASPTSGSQQRKARRAATAATHLARLATVRASLRVHIGSADLSARDLAELRERDVVLVEDLSVRAHEGGTGTATLRVGLGQRGHLGADVFLEGGRYRAKITSIEFGQPAGEEKEGPVEESTMPAESAELLGDIPLRIAVELARVPMTAEEVVSLKVGQVVDLNRVPGEPVELSVNGKLVARGELVEVEGHLGVRILSLAR